MRSTKAGREPEVRYYTDLVNQEFSGITRPHKEIGDDYPYIHKNPLWNACAFFLFHFIAAPLVLVGCKLRYHLRIVNRNVIKPFRRRSYFLYGNHTHAPGDGFFPTCIVFPRKPYEIATADNVALPGLENALVMVGVMPLPTRPSGLSNFMNALETRVKRGEPIVIFPEAHIWPFCTFIRPFPATSFRYPVMWDVPAFCFTVTYQDRRFSDRPRITIYVDGPFYPDRSLSPRESREDLRDRIYRRMCERSKNNTYVKVEYKRKEAALT
jgi:1-acyl-sn-glycerol-3-phosphate acyltransferase